MSINWEIQREIWNRPDTPIGKKRKTYEIQWLNDGPGATGYVGWTPDGIGDDNEFASKRTAEKIMRNLLREASLTSEPPCKMRVVERKS